MDAVIVVTRSSSIVVGDFSSVEGSCVDFISIIDSTADTVLVIISFVVPRVLSSITVGVGADSVNVKCAISSNDDINVLMVG
jgi:hypothetical protein